MARNAAAVGGRYFHAQEVVNGLTVRRRQTVRSRNGAEGELVPTGVDKLILEDNTQVFGCSFRRCLFCSKNKEVVEEHFRIEHDSEVLPDRRLPLFEGSIEPFLQYMTLGEVLRGLAALSQLEDELERYKQHAVPPEEHAQLQDELSALRRQINDYEQMFDRLGFQRKEK